jgi:hypothetical protein
MPATVTRAPRLVPSPTGHPTYIVIDGIQASLLVRIRALTIDDVLNEQPNTARLTVNLVPHAPPAPPFNPAAFTAAFMTTPSAAIYPTIRRGQPIEIYSGAFSADRLVFAGTIVTVRQFYDGERPELVGYYLGCTDFTRALNRRKVTKSYGTQSATAIVADLMSTRLADGFTTAHVAPGLPAVAIDFTFEDMNRALTRLANRIGGYWYVDYFKDLHFFLEEPYDPPAPLALGGEPFDDLQFETDLTQVRTRVIVEGAGTTISASVGPGDTMIPVRDPVMFMPAGGIARTDQQQVSYTGIVTGGLGSLVGPGAQPGSAPTVTPAIGSGVDPGVHSYAVTYTSATGESLPSPAAVVTLGRIDPPAAPPTPNPPTPGNGPDPGVHYYGVTFATPAGETPPSALSAPVTTTQAGGVPAPGTTTAALRNVSGNLAVGVAYAYQTTITTAGGESLPGPAGPAITPAPPSAPPTVTAGKKVSGIWVAGGGLSNGFAYEYNLSYVIGNYETALSPYLRLTATSPAGQVNAFEFSGFQTTADPRVTSRRLWRVVPGLEWRLVATIDGGSSSATWIDSKADAQLGPARGTTGPIGTPPGDSATVTIPSSADPRAVGRRVYRSDDGAPFRYLATVNNLSTPTYLDNTTSVANNADAPTTDTTGGALTCVVPVTGIPIGPPAVTARHLYRTAAGGSQLLHVATIANNTATIYTDTRPDAGLGLAPPATNTTQTEIVELSKIPMGGSGVTARQLYRTAANASTLKFLATLPNNSATTYTDTASDATLGAASPPTIDTSGLTQPQGQVNAGATTIPVAGTAAFSPAGGFAVVGNGEQVLRYTGVTLTALIGIPASGPGALTSTVPYNASITVAPALTGIPASGAGAIARQLIPGRDINLLVMRENLAAQTALAAIEGGSGVIEHYIQDRRLSAAGATTTADAELALFSAPEIRVTYTSRDPRTRTGKTIAINLPAPTNLVGEFLIQRVQLSQFEIPGVAPLRSVQASSTRFSFEDVLRRLELEVYA